MSYVKHKNVAVLNQLVKPAHTVISIKSNLPIRSSLLSQTCPYGHLY